MKTTHTHVAVVIRCLADWDVARCHHICAVLLIDGWSYCIIAYLTSVGHTQQTSPGAHCIVLSVLGECTGIISQLFAVHSSSCITTARNIAKLERVNKCCHKLIKSQRTVFMAHCYAKRCGNIPTGPPNGGAECRGMKNRNFWPISRFISEMTQDWTIVNTEYE